MTTAIDWRRLSEVGARDLIREQREEIDKLRELLGRWLEEEWEMPDRCLCECFGDGHCLICHTRAALEGSHE